MVCCIHTTLQRVCGDKLELDIDPETTVFDLKHRLARIWYLPESHQSITLGTQPLNDAVTLATCCNGNDRDLKLTVVESCGESARHILTASLAEITLQEHGYGVVRLMKTSSRSMTFRVRDTCQPSPHTYVAKCMSLLDVDKQGRDALQDEIAVLQGLAPHPNLVAYHDSFPDESGDNLFVMTSFADSGMLSDLLETIEQPFPQPVVCNWVVQVVQGLNYIHSQGIVHRNLNPSNIFFHNGMRCIRIGSFGYSSINELAAKTLDMDKESQASAYMSPELMRNENHTQQTDMWALGCICFELCTFRLPFEAISLLDLALQIVESEPDWSDWDDSCVGLRDVTQRLLRKESATRPTTAALFEEPLFVQTVAIAHSVPSDSWVRLEKVFESSTCHRRNDRLPSRMAWNEECYPVPIHVR